jgi:hypothetical protein
MNPAAVSETMQGETVTWFQTLAKARNCAITGSLVIAENDTFITDWFLYFHQEKFSIMTKTFVYALRRQGIHAGNQKS